MNQVVTYRNGVYVWLGPFECRQTPLGAGYTFGVWEQGRWATNSPVLASNLFAIMDRVALEQFAKDKARVKAALIESFTAAPTGPCPFIPPEGLSLIPYQAAGIIAGMGRGTIILADEMGLGKTIQAIGIIGASKAKRTLVVCPAFLKHNWKREVEKWLSGSRAEIVDGKKPPRQKADITIINYDILHNHIEWIYERPWDVLIFDESHYLKNLSARRTAISLGGTYQISKYKKIEYQGIPAKKKLYLSGTPVEGSPHELYPILKREMFYEFGSEDDFKERYCTGFVIDRKFIATGAKNSRELQNRLRSTLMIRRLKKDVLTQLPPKQREIVELRIPGVGKIAKEEAAIIGNRSVDDIMQGYSKGKEPLELGDMARIRRAVGLAKVDTCIRYIENILESKEKVIIFGHHKDVLSAIHKAIKGSVLITGDVPMKKRDAIVQEFQEGKARCFIGNIQAAGVGLTLTAADTVVFVEPDWSPSKMTQAEDRAHRIGQLNAVYVIILVAYNTLEARIMEKTVRKQEIIDKTLDK